MLCYYADTVIATGVAFAVARRLNWLIDRPDASLEELTEDAEADAFVTQVDALARARR